MIACFLFKLLIYLELIFISGISRGLISSFISPALFIVETMLSPLGILGSLSNISWSFISCFIFP